MQTLRVEHLTKTYGEKKLFEDLNFIINEHDRIGLIGTNGSGKTTLLNAISGIDPADSGELIHANDYEIGYLQQEPELATDKTVMEAVFEGGAPVFKVIRAYEEALHDLEQNPDQKQFVERYSSAEERMNEADAWTAENDVKTILTQLHLNELDQKVASLSGGQKKRVGLAQILIQNPDLLILDEPTNHLDFDSIDWLEEYLKNYQGALLVVTHDRYFLDHVTNQIYELSFGKMFSYQGNYEAFVRQKAERQKKALQQEHKNQQLYKKELAWMKTGAKARSTKQQARINRFEKLSDKVNDKVQVDKNIDIDLGQQRLGKKVLELKNASLKLGKHQIIHDFSTMINAGDRIGITGKNGAGKTSFLNVLAGQTPLDSGQIIVGETVKAAYYRQQTEQIPEDKRVINYLNEVAQNVTNTEGEQISTTQLLEQFLFPRFMHGTLIRKLSGGEKRRLYLLKLLMMQPNVLFLDEPTNDLDVGTLTILENYLETFAGTVITVSHDRYFLDKVADQLLIFNGDAQIKRYTGQFTDYLKQEKESTKVANKTKNTTVQTAQQNSAQSEQTKVKTKLTYAEQIEFDNLEKEIDQIEQKMTDVKEQMSQISGDDYLQLGDLQQQLNDLENESEQKMARWEELGQYVE
ncbi:ABC-F family ATP-binding cassette domain-containing protein [Ligilactobacillus pobuzihii]|uniref:ABC transporter, ATP-binding protein n=1 Tax=Ligilactobacillus pobuzihii TaxID=449659 RepID=A0A0R2LRY1_9LACO|nr:ABC-F family ATP-binding cassette domain-containing protein [Ligilactobacillus pobuzihii]KRK11432.1 ABC transporter, ATP-binding protein [Ligilactobacillus pobuzihii E100301 = KCTC 13174]KRO02747.1 ABC transporter, ATP-binding protein [Ligilactobacillus pobuzihii]GEN47302.1 ABC transporter ATP-binding protein [Ligilactobacillus pobuzihii]